MFRILFTSFLLLSTIIILPAGAQEHPPITINEIMFRPASANSEFVELFNYSSADTIDLSGYSIKYHTSNADLIDNTNNYLLLPESYCVIFERDYDLEQGIYKNIIPGNALILKIQDNAFGSSGMSNSSNRWVYLLDSSKTIVDSVLYTANNPAGISDEKILPEKQNDSTNWTNSNNINGTPGFKNSATPFLFDAAISGLESITPSPVVGSPTVFSVKIFNAGRNVLRDIKVSFYLITDGNNADKNLFYETDIDSIIIGDSTFVMAEHVFNSPNTHRIYAIAKSEADTNPQNDTAYLNIYIAPKPNKYGDILINEFMYLPQNDEPEWVELYNPTEDSINIKDWRIRDKSSHIILTRDSVYIPPFSYIIISEDSLNGFYSKPFLNLIKNIPSLNNKGDEIVVQDSLGQTIDSVSYSSNWGDSPGISLERISVQVNANDSTNWKNSLASEGATPGYYNSVSPHKYDLNLQSFILRTSYVTFGEDASIRAKIINNGLMPASHALLKVYYDFNSNNRGEGNELLREIQLPLLNPGEEFQLIENIPGVPLGKGNLIAEINFPGDEFLDNNLSILQIDCVQIDVYRSDIVINEIMFAPVNDEPEWIELYNKSSHQVNLKHFLISDLKDTSRIDTNDIVINPDEYLLIAKSPFEDNKYNLNGIVVYNHFPLLNNDEDNLLLMDSLGRTIDSLKYSARWGKSAFSLERVDIYSSSTDTINWKASIDSLRATPLKINSVSQKLYDVKIDTAFYTPELPFLNDNINLGIHISNAGRKRISTHIDILVSPKDTTDFRLYLSSDSVSIDSGKSYSFNFSSVLEHITNPVIIKLRASCNLDQDTTNNYYLLSITPSYNESKICINEFMIYPSGNEPEWVELKNISSDSVNLFNWSISDVITTPKTTTLVNSNLFLAPEEYLVVAKDSSIWEYHKSIPSKTIIIPLANMNNDEDGIVIRDANGITSDSLFYNNTWNIHRGFSLEKIDPRRPGNEIDNWGLSKDVEQGTPGRINSIARKNKDVTITDIFSSPYYPAQNESIHILVKLLNKGYEPINNLNIKVFVNNSGIPELLDSLLLESVDSFDSVMIKTNYTYIIRDSVNITARVSSVEDEDPYNNYFTKTILAGYTEGTVSINELMITPNPDEPEWIEFKNTSGQPINLNHWTITDLLPSPTKKTITVKDVIIQPDSFFIISNDTLSKNIPNTFVIKFGSLSQNEDAIIINDFRGAMLDSLRYNSDFIIEPTRSVERLSIDSQTNDPNNWYPSVDNSGATPGSENSIIYLTDYQNKSIIFNEIMYAPQPDGCEFLELYNRSSTNINLAGWSIIKNDSTWIEVLSHNIQVQPGAYIVIASASSLYSYYHIAPNDTNVSIVNLSLPNAPCSLTLTDFYGNTIDSILYTPEWHASYFLDTKGKSLERINPEFLSNNPNNWSTSVSTLGATPLKTNSIYTKEPETQSNISLSNNPFSPDGDGFEDFTIISYSLTSATSLIRIRLFDDQGRLVRTIANRQPSAGKGQIIFDGLSDNGKPLRVGMYILMLEALDGNGTNLETIKTILVIATKLN